MDPMQALMALDAVVQHANLTRQEHAHLIHCRQIVEAALMPKTGAGETGGDNA